MIKLPTLSKDNIWYKRLEWLDSNFLRLASLFLLFFIPLYPKVPLLDIWQTWVNIRIEDLLVFFTGLFFVLETTKKRTQWKSPLTMPILLYWAIGGVSALHAIIVFVPTDSTMFFHLVALHYFRQVEYMLLFFVVVTSIKSMKQVTQYVRVLLVSVVLVVFYGFGQQYLGFCAFLTGNEEFAKGACLQNPPRNTSTFAGHYDLAAYLVLAISIAGSYFFGISKWKYKLMYLGVAASSGVLLLLTKSRASFFAVIASGIILLIYHRKKWLIVPIIVLGLITIAASSGLRDRFSDTLRVEEVVYDRRTNTPIARVPEFKNTKVVQDVLNAAEIKRDRSLEAVPTPTPFEELPVGTGYLDVPLVYQDDPPRPLDPHELYEGDHPNVVALARNYLVKKTVLYDISFTTRSQGQWPKAMASIARSPVIGSGFSSVGIAVDNNHLRRLAEVGILGYAGYLGIFVVLLLMIRQYVRTERNAYGRSFMIGMAASIVGLMINAVLIDVFDASKVAYTFWILAGVVTGLYLIKASRRESLMVDAYSWVSSYGMAIILIVISVLLLMYSSIANYFIGDDFTWLSWAVRTTPSDILRFFYASDGFFYRPFTKVLMFGLYQLLGENPSGYHVLSMIIHMFSSVVVYLIARKLTGKWYIGLLAGLLFGIHPIHAETILWMSGYSGLFAALFCFSSLYVYMVWNDREGANRIVRGTLYMLSLGLFVLALCSYELAAALPFVLLSYQFVFRTGKKWVRQLMFVLPYFLVLLAYLYIRNTIASAHPLSGDYNYNPGLFPFNAVGNTLGYIAELIIGQYAVPFYDSARGALRENIAMAGVLAATTLGLFGLVYRNGISIRLPRTVIFSLLWFAASLLPVMGLGNIAERYLYMPSAGFVVAMSIGIAALWSSSVAWRRIVGVVLLTGIVLSYVSGFLSASATWSNASQTSYSIVRKVTTTYLSFPPDTDLYFVSIPVRIERAWVYPIGLDNALWLHYRDDTMSVFRTSDVNEALNYKQTHSQTHVFQYVDGMLLEIDPFGTPIRYAETNLFVN